jgi:hypothetical protein
MSDICVAPLVIRALFLEISSSRLFLLGRKEDCQASPDGRRWTECRVITQVSVERRLTPMHDE